MHGDRAYYGVRWPSVCLVYWLEDRDAGVLPPRWDLRNHSPDGYEWGYGGSGPAQLALALLADALDHDNTAETLYQQFKREFVSKLRHEAWVLRRSEIRAWAMLQQTAAGPDQDGIDLAETLAEDA